MMRILIAFLLLLAAVFFGIQLQRDSGYVLIAINHWTIETTLLVAVFGLLLLFLIFYLFMQLIHRLGSTPGSFNRWYNKHLNQKAQDLTRKGLIEYSEGYWAQAKTHLIKALPYADTPLINYLLAARAAQKMGDSTLRDQYLREAQQAIPDAKIAVELTQAQLQMANQQWEQALATLKHLQDLAPTHPCVLKLLMNLYSELNEWKQLIELLPTLKKNQVISHAEFEALQIRAYRQAIQELAKTNQVQQLKALYQGMPKSLAKHPQLLVEYLRFLIQHQEYEVAEDLLQARLRKEFNEQFITLYSLLPTQEKQLNFAESLLKKNQQSAQLYYCLGRMCINLHLWGKAKYYFEQSLERNPAPSTYYELAKLYEKMEDSSLAFEHYKKGLILASK